MRGSRLSCVLCTLLSLFMVMPASVASAATEGSGGSGEVTIHYYDSAGWAKPFAYMYGDGVRSASWPGERMAGGGGGAVRGCRELAPRVCGRCWATPETQ